ncbi:MAG: hypothetical protein WBI48_10285 [Thermacetogeniaceae bacterium]
MEFSEKKAMLLNALIERRGLQYIVNVASQVMNNPIFVYDTSWKILAKSNSRPEDEETWAKLFPEGHLVFKDLLEVERAGIFAQLLNDDKPIFGSFAFFPHRFLGCRVRDKGSVVGIVTMVEINKAQAGDLELMVILSKFILFEMLYCGRTAMQRIPYFGLFKDLIEGNAQENENSRETFQSPVNITKLYASAFHRICFTKTWTIHLLCTRNLEFIVTF